MSKILDLGVLAKQNTFDIAMLDGDVLHLSKPTEELLLDFIAYDGRLTVIKSDPSVSADESALKQMALLRDTVINILNLNVDGIIVDVAYMQDKKINYFLQTAIIGGFGEYMQELSSDPNSKSPQSLVKHPVTVGKKRN